MNIFNLLRKMVQGYKNNTTFEIEEKDVDELLKIATKFKLNGDIDKGINALRKAYCYMEKSDVIYGVSTYLRLPQYLQIAGRNDEAWGEFNLLKMKFKDLGSQGIIEDKMRLFLQREKKFYEAVWFGVLSYLHSLEYNKILVKELKKEGHYQAKDHNDNFEKMCSREGIINIITPLLNKCKKANKIEKIINILQNEINNLSKIDYNKVKIELKKILEEQE